MLHHFNIAGWHVQIDFVHENSQTGVHLIPSFRPFNVSDGEAGEHLLTLTVDDALEPVPEARCERVRTFDTGNGDTVVDRLKDGGYQYIIRDIRGNDCALLICSPTFSECRCALKGSYDMRCFGLNNALMLCYAFAGAFHDTLLIHASLVRHDGYGYAFTAPSGTGKSTQVANWLKTIPNCDLMNDDNPIIRILPECNRPIIYGSPWSGKTPCYRLVQAPLGALTQIARAQENSVERLNVLDALSTVLPACSTMKWDETIYKLYFTTISSLLAKAPIYCLHCTAAPESARVCCDAIKVKS